MNASTNAVEADLMSSIKLNKVRKVSIFFVKINTIKKCHYDSSSKGGHSRLKTS